MRRDKEIKISLTDEEMKKIEEVAKKIGITKSRLARNLTLTALEDAELLAKLGFFDVIKLIEKIRKKAIEANTTIKTTKQTIN
jgi:hypothetical protein